MADRTALTPEEEDYLRTYGATQMDARAVRRLVPRLLATLDAARSVYGTQERPLADTMVEAAAHPPATVPDEGLRREAIADDRAWASGYAAGRAAAYRTTLPIEESYPSPGESAGFDRLVDALRAEYDQGHFIPWDEVVARIAAALSATKAQEP